MDRLSIMQAIKPENGSTGPPFALQPASMNYYPVWNHDRTGQASHNPQIQGPYGAEF